VVPGIADQGPCRPGGAMAHRVVRDASLGVAQPEWSRTMAMTKQPVPGTTIFDGEQAQKGYALNKMCMSFNEAANRRDFLRDEDAYCARYDLNSQQREAIRHRNVLELIAAGGNIYYLAKFAGIFGFDVQDIGAQQTGVSKEEFKARLLAQAGER